MHRLKTIGSTRWTGIVRGGRVDWTVGDRALVVPTTIPRRQLEESLKGSSSAPSQGEGTDLHYVHLPCPLTKTWS